MILGAIVIVVIGALVVNYFRNIDSGSILRENDAASTVDSLSLPTTHTVTSGENLWSIAETYFESGYNWVDIASANELSSPGFIDNGQKLTIPDAEPMQATITIADSSASAINGATYTVASGDSLWDISVRAYGDGYRWSDIASENDLTNPNIIHSGNLLVLPI